MLCYCFFRSLEIINTDNKNAYTALEANLKKVEGERDLANQSFTKIKEERSQLSSEIKVIWAVLYGHIIWPKTH